MDSNRFDALVRSLPLVVARRTALGGLLGVGLGAFLGRLGIQHVEARRKNKKRGKKKTCRGNKKRCGKRCIPKTACCGGCDEEEQCCHGVCIPQTDCCGCSEDQQCCHRACIPATDCCGCSEDQLCCAGTCADCCGNDDCPIDALCVDGVCTCPVAGHVVCGDTCTDLATDPDNCGACGRNCPTPTCIHGACSCVRETDCPEECTCGRLFDPPDKNVCFDGPTLGACDDDTDCPIGSACLANNRCSGFCFV